MQHSNIDEDRRFELIPAHNTLDPSIPDTIHASIFVDYTPFGRIAQYVLNVLSNAPGRNQHQLDKEPLESLNLSIDLAAIVKIHITGEQLVTNNNDRRFKNYVFRGAEGCNDLVGRSH